MNVEGTRMIMKIWLVSRTDKVDYDEYDSCVVAAETRGEAMMIHPRSQDEGRVTHNDDHPHDNYWLPEILEVAPLGVAYDLIPECRVYCASFNAG